MCSENVNECERYNLNISILSILFQLAPHSWGLFDTDKYVND